ncbi:hypothetical protein I552_9949 [Mycobacterium xenopi 3993]|nr:hypothetical protein I552_9949 [Mycobacterium xenopi 3993]
MALSPAERLEVLFEELAELPVSATPLMGALCRSSPSWIATSCAARPVRARWRRWWPGSWAPRRPLPTPSPRWRAG